MKIYPAIDIMGGEAVRLTRGEAQSKTVFGDPVDWALKWQEEGAAWLHLVDLDAAFEGGFVNKDAVKRIVRSVKIPVQIGGGIRTLDAVRERIEEVGVSRVILGTAAIEDPELVGRACSAVGSEQIAVGIDAKDGKVVTRGWVNQTEVPAVELAMRVKQQGAQTIIYTDVMRDGMMGGANTEKTGELVKKTLLNIIASGGISSMEDVLAVRDCGASGAILGRALYNGKLDLKEVLKVRK